MYAPRPLWLIQNRYKNDSTRIFQKRPVCHQCGCRADRDTRRIQQSKTGNKPEHLNAGQRTQGGAIFTLADLALAAAANSHGTLAFSLSSNITFLRASGPGDTLYAEARERYTGRSTGYYQIDVTDQEGRLIATFESSVFRKKDEVPFTL